MVSARRLTFAVVIATAHREDTLKRCIERISQQEHLPDRIIVADGAPAPGVESLVTGLSSELDSPVLYHRCRQTGAAPQRNEAAELVFEDIILFMDDDVYVGPGCLQALMSVLESDEAEEIGGVGVILTNQHYRQPSKLFKKWLDLMAGEKAESYAGRVIGPAINICAAPASDGSIVEVEWLNTGCTAYRREAFNAEKFSPDFYGYSVLEDVHLSLRIGRHRKLMVTTAARAFHDSQPSRFKRPFVVAKMQVKNRYLVMTEVLNRCDSVHHIKFFLAVFFGVACRFREIRSLRRLREFISVCTGSAVGLLIVSWRFCAVFLRPGARNRLANDRSSLKQPLPETNTE